MPTWLPKLARGRVQPEKAPAPPAGPQPDDVPPRRLAAIAAAITAYLEAEAEAAGRTAPGFVVKTVSGTWAVRPGSTQGLGWAQVGRMENMLERQHIATRRRTS